MRRNCEKINKSCDIVNWIVFSDNIFLIDKLNFIVKLYIGSSVKNDWLRTACLIQNGDPFYLFKDMHA